MQHDSVEHAGAIEHGPRFIVNIEGAEHEWPRRTITAREVATLGGWDVAQGVLLIDAENNERQLDPDEVVELRPGLGFAKRVRFKRGSDQ